jgi:hypothetical protein
MIGLHSLENMWQCNDLQISISSKERYSIQPESKEITKCETISFEIKVEEVPFLQLLESDKRANVNSKILNLGCSRSSLYQSGL